MLNKKGLRKFLIILLSYFVFTIHIKEFDPNAILSSNLLPKYDPIIDPTTKKKIFNKSLSKLTIVNLAEYIQDIVTNPCKTLPIFFFPLATIISLNVASVFSTTFSNSIDKYSIIVSTNSSFIL